jgi:hypothetical protein
MTKAIEFHSRTQGSLGENEDWYRLIVEEDGSRVVEHEWSHTNAYKVSQSDSGSKRISVEEFLRGAYDQTAKGKLSDLITRL